MAPRRRQLVTIDDVALPPYAWTHGRRGTRSAWGVKLPISTRHDLQLLAQRGTAGRWTWTVIIYRTGKPDHVAHIARGVEATLTAAKPAAESAAKAWLLDQLGLSEDDRG